MGFWEWTELSCFIRWDQKPSCMVAHYDITTRFVWSCKWTDGFSHITPNFCPLCISTLCFHHNEFSEACMWPIWIHMLGLMLLLFQFCFLFPICSLINKLKPGIIKRVNRRSTPIAGLVSDVINPVFCCSTSISRSSCVREVHDGSNQGVFETIQAQDVSGSLACQWAAEYVFIHQIYMQMWFFIWASGCFW